MDDKEAGKLRDLLLTELAGRRSDIRRLYAYYRGDHPLPWAPTEVADAYLALMKMGRSNWCRLIVQAPAERLRVVGLRFSEDSEDLPSDVEVWKRLWQSNRMDLESRMIHNAALIARRGFALVWPSEDGPPSITPEHPSQIIVQYAPGNRRKRTAALKTFDDPATKKRYCTLWTPETVYNWIADYQPIATTTATTVATAPQGSAWKPWFDSSLGIYPEADNPMGCVSVVEFQAHPEMIDEPLSELDGGVTDVQDRINKTVLDRLVTSNFASFPQKILTGLELEKDDNGDPVQPFKNAVNRLWTLENPDAKWGTFEVADLAGYIKSVESDIQHLAATTRTPPHYLLGQSGAFPSGDSLKATETGLLAKCGEIRDAFTESHEDVIRLALKADGDPRCEDYALAMRWMNPESRSDAEVMDAATKQQAIGVPWEAIMEYIGKTPEEIARMDVMRAEDAANGLLGPPPVVPGKPPVLVA